MELEIDLFSRETVKPAPKKILPETHENVQVPEVPPICEAKKTLEETPALDGKETKVEKSISLDLFQEVIPENAEDTTGEHLMKGIEARENRTIRVFQLLYPTEEYKKVEAAFVALRKKFGFDNNSEVVRKLLYDHQAIQ